MSPESIKKAVIVRGTGHSQKEIALELGVSQQTVGKWMKRLKRNAEKNGVDETLSKVFVDAINDKLDMPLRQLQLVGMLQSQINSDAIWWLEHYRTNAHWLIRHLWELCQREGEELTQLQSICKGSIGAFAETYGFDLEEYKTRRGNK